MILKKTRLFLALGASTALISGAAFTPAHADMRYVACTASAKEVCQRSSEAYASYEECIQVERQDCLDHYPG